MKIVELQQGSEEWRAFRNTRCTATDFAVIAAGNNLCKNYFSKSIDRLRKEKKENKIIPDNPYFALGRKYEPIILNMLDFSNVLAGETITHDDNERLMASLDARDHILECVIEIKTTSKSEAQLDDLINYYKFQVAHQCYVSGYHNGCLAIGLLEHNEELKTTELMKIIQIDMNVRDIISYDYWHVLCNTFLLGI